MFGGMGVMSVLVLLSMTMAMAITRKRERGEREKGKEAFTENGTIIMAEIAFSLLYTKWRNQFKYDFWANANRVWDYLSQWI